MPEIKIGGSFAPPLPVEKLAEYRALAESASPPVAEAMHALCTMMEQYHAGHHEPQPTTDHPLGLLAMMPLDETARLRLEPHIPWMHECTMYGTLFDGIDPVGQRDLRNAAHHLLWHAVELTLDRHPLTADKLPQQSGKAIL